MKLLALGVAISLAALAGCERRPMTPPSPKTDSVSQARPAGVGSTTTPANAEILQARKKSTVRTRFRGRSTRSTPTSSAISGTTTTLRDRAAVTQNRR
jgi:hypothetical protein